MQDTCHPAIKLIMHMAKNPLGDDDDQATADLLFEHVVIASNLGDSNSKQCGNSNGDSKLRQ